VSERKKRGIEDAWARLKQKSTPRAAFIVKLTMSLNFTSERANHEERSDDAAIILVALLLVFSGGRRPAFVVKLTMSLNFTRFARVF